MSKVEAETYKEKQRLIETRVTPVSFNQQCFDRNWVSQLNNREQIGHFICLICKQVANNPVEISCTQHDGMDEILIAGENCLKQFLNNNNNTCPVQHHDGCKYHKVKAMQRLINEMNVICQMQFNQDLKTTERNEEGQTDGKMTVICDFKGKIKDMNEHLNHSCALKLSNCWFKQFGCEYTCLNIDLKQHLIENIKQHFDLVINKFKLMQQIIKQQQDEITQLKSEKELNDKKQNEDALILQQLTKEIFNKDIQSSDENNEDRLVEKPAKKKNEKPTKVVEAKEKKEEWEEGPEGLKFRDLRVGDGKVEQEKKKIKKQTSLIKCICVFSDSLLRGQLPNQKVFDKRINGEGFEFKVGRGEVIQGWEKGLLGMKVGGKRRLLIPAKLGYGEEGSEPDIPPNTDLTFTIEVKAIW
ncbi:hypothetical protein RFI_06942 [Reticulomyxa filosa]|uniref:peptidylprolyl isomerase n=1 Tax=Reticulomyxa filosa TaxID=46433 RepID=X6NWB9_RETFI|nr:hypothetical protein RFI_06942 [Reticulomyxa filosa]|eukprot:ETO30178.1 hypothetical protein RFI_06942 [Reticulomyxa filosa]